MAKEVYLYSGIYDFTAEALIEKLEAAEGDEVVLRINSGGGSVFAGWGVCAKMQELGNVNIKVDGVAASMAGIFCLFANKVECLDVTRFMLHRGSAYIRDEEDQKRLDSINKDVKAKMKAKLDAAAFKECFGYTIDDLFATDKDCWMTAKEAKKIGLVDKINKLDPNEAKAYEDLIYKVAAELKGEIPKPKEEFPKSKNMTLAELKAQHPALYEAAANDGFQLGLKEGVQQEKDRIESFLTFMEIDPAGVKAGIESGKGITAKQMSEFALKSVTAATNLQTLETESKDKKVTTAAPAAGAKTEKDKELEKFETELFASLGVGKKEKTKTVFGYVKLLDAGGAVQN